MKDRKAGAKVEPIDLYKYMYYHPCHEKEEWWKRAYFISEYCKNVASLDNLQAEFSWGARQRNLLEDRISERRSRF